MEAILTSHLLGTSDSIDLTVLMLISVFYARTLSALPDHNFSHLAINRLSKW